MNRKIQTDSVITTVLVAFLVFLIVCAVSFFATAGVLWVINWAFGLSFWNWRTCIGVWLALMLLTGGIKAQMKVEQ